MISNHEGRRDIVKKDGIDNDGEHEEYIVNSDSASSDSDGIDEPQIISEPIEYRQPDSRAILEVCAPPLLFILTFVTRSLLFISTALYLNIHNQQKGNSMFQRIRRAQTISRW